MPSAKKNTPVIEQAARRAPEQTQISISLPRKLLAKIDAAAKAENRNRSNFITTHLEEIVTNKNDAQKKKKKK